MRLLIMIGLLTASGCLAQEQAPGPQEPATQAQAPAPGAAQKQAITIPAGTRVPLTLTNPIHSKSSRRGDSVRAVTAFPVAVGTQVAIPAGTYVEGVLDKVIKRGPSGHAGLQMHFTRILFASGYNVPLDGATAEAKAGSPGVNLPEASTPGSSGANGNVLGFQQTPGPAPLPRLGPSIGLVTAIGVGVVAATLVTAVLFGRHRGGDTFFDAGSPFEMVLQGPLSLDADSVAAALAGPNAQ